MSKGSGRRRITPADGIKYDPVTEEVDERVARSFQSLQYDIDRGYRDGAYPTAKSWYGSNGIRRGGKGRKNDNRCWKTAHKGKQYDRGYS